MKVAIVGSRNWKDNQRVKDFIDTLSEDTVIVSGGAKGVDTVAETYARQRGLKVEIYLPDWDMYGRSAGVLRNKDIVNNSDCVVAFWDGKSRGTLNTIERAIKSPHIRMIRIEKVINSNGNP